MRSPVLVSGLLTLSLAVSTPIPAGAEMKAAAEELKKEGDALEKARLVLVDTYKNLSLKKSAVDQDDGNIKKEESSFHKAKTELNLALDGFKNQSDSFKSYCTGTFPEPEYSKRLAWCGPKEGQLKDLKKELLDRVLELSGRENRLPRLKAAHSKATLDLAVGQKKFGADREDWQARADDWMKRLRHFLTSPAVKELEQSEAVGKACESIPVDASGGYPFEKQLNGAAERAHHCLQVVWDRAKS